MSKRSLRVQAPREGELLEDQEDLDKLDTENSRSSTDEVSSTFRKALARATGAGGLLVPKDSLYGSVIVLPQVARSLDYHPVYVGKALVAWMCLVLVLGMQGMFVYEVYKMVMSKDTCCSLNPDPCLEEGFMRGGPAWWGVFGVARDRWYLCYPELDATHRAQVLRKLCVGAFVVCLFKDIRQTYEMVVLLRELPSETGTWLVISTLEEEVLRVDTNGEKKFAREKDEQIHWQVDCMELHWKVLVLIAVIVPKLLIFAFLYFYGSIWLMNVVDHQELILNAVALVFVLELDEAVFAAVTTSDVQQQMDNLQPWNPHQSSSGRASENDETKSESSDEGWDRSKSSADDQGATFTIMGTVQTLITVLTFPALLVFFSFIVINWYDIHCSPSSDIVSSSNATGGDDFLNYCLEEKID